MIATLLLALVAATIPQDIAYETFDGKIRHQAGFYDVQVDFNSDNASYQISDGTKGTLTFVKHEGHTILFNWEDQYGKGNLLITFDKKYQSFRGRWWNPDQQYLQGSWTGLIRKQE